MDPVNRKVFLIDDVNLAENLASIHNDAFNYQNEEKIRPNYYEDVLMEGKKGFRLYGVNNIYDGLIGFAFYSLTRYRRGIANLNTLAVMRRYQGRHVGTLLLRESLFDLVTNNNISVVRATVLSSLPVLSFYQNRGFVNQDGTPIDVSHTKPECTRVHLLTR